LLQNLISLCEMVANMGIGVAVVRSGAIALANQNYAELASLRKATFILYCILGGSTATLLMLFRNEASYWMLGGTEHSGSVLFLAVAVLLRLASNLQNSFLNAYHQVGVMAKAGILDSIFVSLTYIVAVWLFGFDGVVPMMIAGAAISWMVSRFFLPREITANPVSTSSRNVKKAARSLLAVGGPYTISLLVGAGVQLLLPALVLHILSAESVGYYRAAVSISIGYSSLLIASFTKDYLPRVSAVADNPAEIVNIINQHQYIVLLFGSPLILAGLAIVPYLVPLLFSTEFQPTTEILEWLLIGDLFKLSSWTMSYVILVRCRGATFFLTELFAGLIFLLTSWIGIRWFGLSGLGISYLLTYAVYYFVVWIIVRRDIDLVCTTANKKMLFLAVASALAIRMLSWTVLNDYRIYFALALALLMAAMSFNHLRHEFWKMRRAGIKS
jgi:O-antigen/teichoic acid export membrane protein